MAIEFLALPDEQHLWLSKLLAIEGHWCWIRLFGKDSRIIVDPHGLDDVRYDSEDLMEFDLGRSDVQGPVFERTGNRVHLDFPRSLAVQFKPSVILEEQTLITGQLAISSRGWYEYYGMESDSLFKWYGELSKSWKKKFCDDYMLIDRVDGKVTEARFVHLTEGAIEWWRLGKKLKHATNLTFDLEVAPRTPRKPKTTTPRKSKR